MTKLALAFSLIACSCRSEPAPPAAPPMTPPTVTNRGAPAEAPAAEPRRTTRRGGIVEPRVVTSERRSGEIHETHARDDGSVAFEATYAGDRLARMRAVTAAGKESWACELTPKRAPRCVVRDPTGNPLSEENLAARNFDARKRLEAARELLAPPGHEGEDEHEHSHSHFKAPPPSKETMERWQKKRSAAWADAEPWFDRVDALMTLGLPTVVATDLAKEELSSGFWVFPAKKPIDGHPH